MDRTRFARRTVLVGAAAALLAACSTPKAERVVPEPRIISTDEWGATFPTSGGDVIKREPAQIVIHHTETPNVADLSRDQALTLARAVQKHHMQSNGWSDSGQHFTISRGGFVLEGRHGSLNAARRRDRFVEGAQAKGANDRSIGIENEGTYHSERPPEQQWEALVDLVAWLCDSYQLGPEAIVGHRDVSPSTCPGDAFAAVLTRLRTEVSAMLRPR
ncbi:N-acetylmuramoyl-L-alanine amidase [Enemella dayhoffiae]|uniref:N-acetylmuramoyl-L-alanine amidase n=1 Tax=Enemella dayhoffiae TaxID=2016507 RepID=A0A255H799_9ACTN|nr:peptidoglycan recognition family protein [Enemella dayhoffiae]OYO23083.1 N-acetylmuramoyl-L-alanine amidase [Enemella dayhoffiae]